MIYLNYVEEAVTMNRYGLQIKSYWKTNAPIRYFQLVDPESFFSDLGELVATQVAQTTTALAGPDPKDEGYLEKVARLNSATSRAEEMVLAELDWPAVELSDAEDRSEWEATRPMDQGLVDWAVRMYGETLYENDVEEMEAEWLLAPTFIRGLAAARNPWEFLDTHAEELSASTEARYQRFRAQTEQ